MLADSYVMPTAKYKSELEPFAIEKLNFSEGAVDCLLPTSNCQLSIPPTTSAAFPPASPHWAAWLFPDQYSSVQPAD